MKKENAKTIITVLVTILLLCAGYLYIKRTAPTRQYKAEIKQLKLISEHQALEIEVQRQKMEIEAIKREVEKQTPSYKLTPKDPNE